MNYWATIPILLEVPGALLATTIIVSLAKNGKRAPTPLARLARDTLYLARLGSIPGAIHAAATIIFHAAIAAALLAHTLLSPLTPTPPELKAHAAKAAKAAAATTTASSLALLALHAANKTRRLPVSKNTIATHTLATLLAATSLTTNIKLHVITAAAFTAHYTATIIPHHTTKTTPKHTIIA